MRIFKKKKSSKDKQVVSGLPPDMVYSMEPRQGHGQDVFDENGIRQVAGCLPIDPINKRFLLVTSSSNNGTWVIPKGGWEKDETQQQAAMRETWEEAGVKGVITRHIGVFAEKSKGEVKAHHWIYEMEIKEVTKKFPEQKKRERRWFSYDEAMLVVKASYIHDALSMSSLSRLAHPQCDSLTSNTPNSNNSEKKKKKKKKIVEEESNSDSEREKEKKKEKKKKKKENNDSEEEVDENGIPLTEEQKEQKKQQKKLEKQQRKAAAAAAAGENSNDSEEEDAEKKKKKKKKKNKGGEIVELNENELPPMNSTPPLPQPVDEKVLAPINQQLRQTHITGAPYPHANQFPIIPQQQFSSNLQPQPRPSPSLSSQLQQHQHHQPQPRPSPSLSSPYQPQPRSPPMTGQPYPRHPQQQGGSPQQSYQRPPPPSQHPFQQQRQQQLQQQQQQQQQPHFPHHQLFPQQQYPPQQQPYPQGFRPQQRPPFSQQRQ